MRPHKLVMENFGPFSGRAEVDFSRLDDIFLVTGKTGAGKTSIFDGICFALYGTVPGSRAGHVVRLLSDYAEKGAECFVSLEFYLGSRLLKVDRGIRELRSKIDKTVVFYQRKDEAWIPVSSRPAEADRQIRELLRLGPQEFFKIVLLPQGEFAEFLRLNTRDRKEILGRLFPVELASRVMRKASEQAKELRTLLGEAERALDESLKHLNFDDYPRIHDEHEKTLREAQELEAVLEQSCRELENWQRLDKNLNDAESRCAALKESLERLASGEEEQRRDAERLALSKKARPLAEFLNRAGERDAGYTAALTAREEGLRRLEAAEVRNRACEQDRERASSREAELAALRERRPFLEELCGEARTLRDARAECGRLKEQLGRADADLTAARGELESLEEKAADLRKAADTADALEKEWEILRERKDLFMELKRLCTEREELIKTMEEARRKSAEKEALLAGYAKEISRLEEEQKTLAEEKKRSDHAGAAASLAEDLREGEPCPVCGAVHHPAPAGMVQRQRGLEEQLGALEKMLREKAEQRAMLHSGRENHEREAASLAVKKGALEQQIRPLLTAAASGGGELPRLDEAAALLEKQIASLNQVTQARDDARRARSRLDSLYREKQNLLAAMPRREADRAALSEKLAGRERLIGETETKQQKLLARWQTPAGAVPEELLAETGRSIVVLEEESTAFQKEREEVLKELAAARSEEEASAARLKEAADRKGEAAAELREELVRAGFADSAALKVSLLPAAEETVLEERLQRRREEKSRLESALEVERRNLETIREELAAAGEAGGEDPGELEVRRKKAGRDREQAAAALVSLEQEKKRLDDAAGKREELAKRAETYAALDNDLRGNNPKKIPFDAWLLGLCLSEIIFYATIRLEKMSEGRFSLHLNDSAGSKGYQGLDIAVFDTDTGRMRPCATLSGGESFLASISLALGLADSIQARSGGVRLDSVFIDEGFGSLDDQALNNALSVLDDLRETRMVGLISHVSEMKALIPSRIEVIKTGIGSTIMQGPL